MPLIEFSNLNDQHLLPFKGMKDGQLRRGEGFRHDNPQGFFIGESARVIERALDAGVQLVSVLVDNHWFEHDRKLMNRIMTVAPEIPIFRVRTEEFKAITGYEVVRGTLACFMRPALHRAEDIITYTNRVVILEDITNYTNIGTIFRSAAALGWDAILVTPLCYDPYYRRCVRASMGAVFKVPWARIVGEGDWADGFMPLLRKACFTTIALELCEKSIDLRNLNLSNRNRLAIVLGTEGSGLRNSTIQACDYTVMIPMQHEVDSLNVAASAAIAFWELGKRDALSSYT